MDEDTTMVERRGPRPSRPAEEGQVIAAPLNEHESAVRPRRGGVLIGSGRLPGSGPPSPRREHLCQPRPFPGRIVIGPRRGRTGRGPDPAAGAPPAGTGSRSNRGAAPPVLATRTRGPR